jgi:tetratricopeptide (TPR) repeat protein
LRGSLGDLNVADLILEAYLSKSTGILRLTQTQIKKSLYFRDGNIIFAHSNLKSDRLGDILLKLGKITQEDFQTLSFFAERGVRLGQILCDKGFLTESQVASSVVYQVEQIIYSVFNWDYGDYEFLQRDRPVFEDIMVELPTTEIILQGIRNITNLFVLERGIGEGDDKIVFITDHPPRFLRSDFDYSEQTILSCIDGRNSLGKLRSMSRLSSYEFGRAMNCLLVSGVIHFQGAEQQVPLEDSGRIRRKWGAFSTQPIPAEEEAELPASLEGAVTLSEEAMRELILRTEIQLQDITDEEVLQLLPDSTPEEIQKAYEGSVKVYSPAYQSEDRYLDLKDKLEFILDRFAIAHKNLMEKARRSKAFATVTTDEVEEAFPQLSPEDSIEQEQIKDFPELEVEEFEFEFSQRQESVALESPAPAVKQDMAKEDPGPLCDLGRKAQSEGNLKEAEQFFLRALEVDPKKIDTHFALADFYQQQGLKFKAFKHLNAILKLEPSNQRALDMLGIKKRKKAMYEI